MKEFTYKINDEIGIHARPAGNLAKIAKESECDVTISSKGKNADLKKIFSVLSLAVKCGDEIKITVDGRDEAETAEKIKKYLTEKL